MDFQKIVDDAIKADPACTLGQLAKTAWEAGYKAGEEHMHKLVFEGAQELLRRSNGTATD